MIKETLYFVFLLLFLIVACTPRASIYKAPLKDEGEVFIYLQPMPQEAQRLRFTIDGISAVREDGTDFPLFLSLKELKGAELAGVQKLLTSGIMPPGSYKGISILLSEAFVKTEEGEAALLIPEKTIMIEHMFSISKRKAQPLFLSFEPLRSITDVFSFTPVFTFATEVRELKNLKGYITNSDSNIISVFNKKTMQVVDAISTGMGPRGLALNQSRGLAYVAVSGDNAVEVIDVLTGEITGRITLNLGDEPRDVSLTPDGRTLLSVNYGSNTVSIIDANVLFELDRIRVGMGPTSAVIDPLGLKAYVVNSISNTLSVVDLSRNVLSATIAVEEAPLKGAFNRNGDRLYVISGSSPNLTVINPSSLSVIGKIFAGFGSVSIKVDTQTDLILVGNKVGGKIAVIDPSSLILIDTIDAGGTAVYMTIDSEENTLFVLLHDTGTLLKVNLVSKRIIDEVEVGEGANSVAVMGER